MRRVNKANGATIDFLWAYDALRNRKRLNELQGPWPRRFGYDPFGRLVHIGIPFGPYTDLYQDGPDTALMHSGVRSDQPFWTRFVHGPGDDQVLAMEVYAPNADPTPGTGQQFYFHADGEGSIRLVTDSTGNIANRYDYDSFGRRIAVTESVQQPYGWKGRDFLAGPDIYYNRARFYDPVLGKFIAEDPLGFAGGDTNLYAFVRNNPRNWKDPTGLFQQSGDYVATAGIMASATANVALVGCLTSMKISSSAAYLAEDADNVLVGMRMGPYPCTVEPILARRSNPKPPPGGGGGGRDGPGDGGDEDPCQEGWHAEDRYCAWLYASPRAKLSERDQSCRRGCYDRARQRARICYSSGKWPNSPPKWDHPTDCLSLGNN